MSNDKSASETGPGTEHDDNKPLTLLEVASSCLAAVLGVQSKSNKERDFRRGKPIQFIIVGVIFLGLFLATVITAVSIITSH